MTSTTLLSIIARFVADVGTNGISPALQQDVKRRIMDTLGIELAASILAPAQTVEEVISEWGGNAQASLVGRSRKYPAISAALFNGTAAHSLDFDDTHLPSVLHPSACIIPAVLAVAETERKQGKDILAAIAVGDELTVRIGMAGYSRELGNSVFFEKGLHATSIAGTLGAAAAAAMLYDLDETKIGHAIAIAASMGAGIIEANRTGGSVKRIHCGWAAHGGISAAQLARHGMTGPPTVFEGRFGFLQAYLDQQVDEEALISRLGEKWELPHIFFKPYPTNHFTHAGIDAARLLKEQGLDIAQIAEIELGVPTAVLRTIAQPVAEKARPATGYAAQFSGPFTVATALVGGGGLGVATEDFTDEAVHNPVKLNLAARVRCVANEECDRIFPNQFPAILRVFLQDGSVREARVLANRGGPENPLSDEELGRKFATNASKVLSAERITQLLKTIETLDTLDTISDLMSLTRPNS
jgi:2-methylcitrate dehydratase PrpD